MAEGVQKTIAYLQQVLEGVCQEMKAAHIALEEVCHELKEAQWDQVVACGLYSSVSKSSQCPWASQSPSSCGLNSLRIH